MNNKKIAIPILFVAVLSLVFSGTANGQIFPISYQLQQETQQKTQEDAFQEFKHSFEGWHQLQMLYGEKYFKELYNKHLIDNPEDIIQSGPVSTEPKKSNKDDNRDKEEKYCSGKGEWNGNKCVINDEEEQAAYEDAVCDDPSSNSNVCGGGSSNDEEDEDSDNNNNDNNNSNENENENDKQQITLKDIGRSDENNNNDNDNDNDREDSDNNNNNNNNDGNDNDDSDSGDDDNDDSDSDSGGDDSEGNN